jgi:type VI secretion system secreted protein VgrG
MLYTQENRLISLQVLGLDDNLLLLAGFSGHEAISRLFSFHLDLLSQHKYEDIKPAFDKAAVVSVKLADGTLRYFHGFLVRFALSGYDSLFTRYQAELVPYQWKLTRRANCRIFHNKTVDQIVKTILDEMGCSNYHLRLNTTYPTMEYCVQYRETDFNFISRLMEEYGIFYFFQHTSDAHTMIIADSSTVHDPCPKQKSASYSPDSGRELRDADFISAWSLEVEQRSGKYSLTDYNFMMPSANLGASETTIFGDKYAPLEIFDYPGGYTTRSDGTTLAKLRMQEEEVAHVVITGAGVCRDFTSGYKFNLTDHDQDWMNDSYVLTEIQHTASVNYSTGESSSSGDAYSNHFTCIAEVSPFRPPRITPKPFVQGPQTAVVIGKKDYTDTSGDDGGGDGEEIWVDKYGRVVVRFPWDRPGNCSCRVRVSQDWAGQGWGSITIPRVGQEVIVSFLEGDPDRPIITGRVYNAEQMPPYTLPDNQTQTGIKTRSSKGGTADNYNEIRFEDKKDHEDLLIHAERTMHNSVEASQFITVGADRHITTGGVDKDGNKVGDVKEKVFKNHNLHVLGDQRTQIEGDSDFHVQGEAEATYDKDIVINVTKKCVILADTIQLQGTTKIVLIAGSSSLVIDAGGVTVLGTPLINLNTPGAPPVPEMPPLVIDPDDP